MDVRNMIVCVHHTQVSVFIVGITKPLYTIHIFQRVGECRKGVLKLLEAKIQEKGPQKSGFNVIHDW